MSDESWRLDLQKWAMAYLHSLAERPEILGVVMGGSLARGQEWLHSDLEVGILVEQKLESQAYFNVDSGRGVEIIQLMMPQLKEQLVQVRAGDLGPVALWPIQLWQCRIIYDPSGVFSEFKDQFDTYLFSSEVLEKRKKDLRLGITDRLTRAQQLIAASKPKSALVELRQAMNSLILLAYWSFEELPRSQSRTDSRLLSLCQRHDVMPLYELYQDVFALANVRQAIDESWPQVKTEVLELTRRWGDSAREFFIHAVDSDFEWGEDAGILTVYRLYIPIIGEADQALQSRLDDEAWASENKALMNFLGFVPISREQLAQLVSRIETFASEF
ncbi:MAG: hypothetical protein KC422_08780 [Trueperaceae bacterium]|nr:hypothetical protein [Trueperaceae bacterium]